MPILFRRAVHTACECFGGLESLTSPKLKPTGQLQFPERVVCLLLFVRVDSFLKNRSRESLAAAQAAAGGSARDATA